MVVVVVVVVDILVATTAVPPPLIPLWLVHSRYLIALLRGLLLAWLLVLGLLVLLLLVLLLLVLGLPLRWIVGLLSRLSRLLPVPLLLWWHCHCL